MGILAHEQKFETCVMMSSQNRFNLGPHETLLSVTIRSGHPKATLASKASFLLLANFGFKERIKSGNQALRWAGLYDVANFRCKVNRYQRLQAANS